MSTATATIAAQLRDLAYELENVEEQDIVQILARSGGARDEQLEAIAYEFPYGLSQALINRAPAELRTTVEEDGWIVFDDVDAIIAFVTTEHAEAVVEELRQQGETTGPDPDEVERLAELIEGLASDVGYVRNRDLDEVVDELDDLSRQLSDAASELKNLL